MPVGKDAPRPQARLRLHHPSGFGLCDKMPENQRRPPGEWLLRIAYGVIFVTVRIIHQKRADAIRAHLRRQAAILFPLAVIFPTDLGAGRIDAASPGAETVSAQCASLFREFLDFENLAAKMAGAA